jgi:hypothetical protein
LVRFAAALKIAEAVALWAWALVIGAALGVLLGAFWRVHPRAERDRGARYRRRTRRPCRERWFQVGTIKLPFRLKMGAVRANFRDWLASDRSKRAKIARKLDCSAWHPSFHTVCKNYGAPVETGKE